MPWHYISKLLALARSNIFPDAEEDASSRMLLFCYYSKILKTGQVVQQEEFKTMLWMNKDISKNLHLRF
jgi:hypothetical protein